jgi:LmbE family N-acetylglucosaminyl deacetylase
MPSRPVDLFSEARREQSAVLPTPQRALAIGAHPDDAEFGAGGTLAKWAAAGCEVSILIATDGSKGSWNPDQDPAELIAQRREETARAAEVLGASGEIVFLDHVDGELVHSMRLREQLSLWIRRLRPEVVLSWDPWKRYMLHPDHREIGWGAVDGVVAARDHLFFPHQLVDGVEKWRPDAVLLFAADEPDHWEDITDSFDTKIDALLCHTSQSQSTMQNAATDGEGLDHFRARIHDWCTEMGAPAGLELAEAFKLVRP